MSKIKYRLFAVIAFVLCAIFSTVTGLVLQSQNGSAATTLLDDDITVVYADSSIGIDRTNLNSLYQKLARSSSATYSSVNTLASTPRTATYIAGGPAGEFTVKFGNMEWDPVYLSKTTKGDVILTLWLSDIYPGAMIPFAGFSNTSNGTYPSCMYSSSMIRSYLTGSYYATNVNTCNSKVDNSGLMAFAATYGSYIATPSQVSWQLIESASADMVGKPTGVDSFIGQHYVNNMPNEAAGKTGIPNDAIWAGNINPIFTGSKYFDWADDKLWIPSSCETGSASPNSVNFDFYGIWRCLDKQIKSSNNVWQRSAANYDQVFHLSSAGAYEVQKINANGGVRPAFHLNLTRLEAEAVHHIEKPANATQSFDYTGNLQNMQVPQNNNLDYELTQKKDGEGNDDAVFLNGYLGATNIGTYTVTATPQAKCFWTDGTVDPAEYTLKITPAAISVNLDDTSAVEENKKNRTYIYRISEGTPDSYPLTLNESLVSTVNGQPFTITYLVLTHAEDQHNQSLLDEPGENDLRWGYTGYDMTEATAPGGYVVWYKITAPNHATKIDYFTVHISSEELEIEVNSDLGEVEYGSAQHTQSGIRDLVHGKVTITDANDHGVINPDDIDMTDLVFYFFYYEDNVRIELNMSESGVRWNVGTYYLDVRYTDGDSNHFVHFKWKNDIHPSYTIKPVTRELTWTGVEGSNTNFTWVYDGQPHAPIATYIDVDNNPRTISATGEVDADTYDAIITDIQNYTFTNTTQSFEITKATNEWVVKYRRSGWALGGTASTPRTPQPKFGEAVVQYFIDEEMTQATSTFNTARIYYVLITVSGNDNWTALEDTYQFTVFPEGTIVPPEDWDEENSNNTDNPSGGNSNPDGNNSGDGTTDPDFNNGEDNEDGDNGGTADTNPSGSNNEGNTSEDLENKKDAAKEELEKAAQAKKDAIDASDMTDEEKAAAKAKVDAELAAGKEAIDNATDESGVSSAESTAKSNIENISTKSAGGSFPWWILAVIAGAIVLLTVLIIVIVKRRNADDDDGYDDYYDDEYDYDEEEEGYDDGDEAYGY